MIKTVSICQCYSSAEPPCLAISSLPYTYSLFPTEEFIIKQLIHSIKAIIKFVCFTHPLFRSSLLDTLPLRTLLPSDNSLSSYQCSCTTGTVFEQVHYRYLLKSHQSVLIKTVHRHFYLIMKLIIGPIISSTKRNWVSCGDCNKTSVH